MRPSSRRKGVGKQFKKESVPGVLSLPEVRQSNILNLRVENAIAVFKGRVFRSWKGHEGKERCDLQAGGKAVTELQCPRGWGKLSMQQWPAWKSVSLLRQQVTVTSWLWLLGGKGCIQYMSDPLSGSSCGVLMLVKSV